MYSPTYVLTNAFVANEGENVTIVGAGLVAAILVVTITSPVSLSLIIVKFDPTNNSERCLQCCTKITI